MSSELAAQFDAAVRDGGASYDRLVTLAAGDVDALTQWLQCEERAGRIERVNGHPEADGTLTRPCLYVRSVRRP